VNALGRTAENALADDQQTSTKKFLMNVFCAAGCKLQHEKYPGSKKYVQAQGAAGWNHLSVHQRFHFRSVVGSYKWQFKYCLRTITRWSVKVCEFFWSEKDFKWSARLPMAAKP